MQAIRTLGLCLILAACGGETVRYTSVTPVPTERVAISYRSVSVREVSLPTYAASEIISVEDPGGVVVETPDILWADDPVRSVTLGLSRALASVTGARVASDPWPFQSIPDVTVDVRLERFVAESGGRFVAEGQYFVAPEDPDRREHAHTFAIAVPYDPTGGYTALAAARDASVTALALDLARRSLR